MGSIKAELLSALEERITEIKESNEAGKGKPKKNCPYDKFMACKPSPYKGEVNPVKCQRWLAEMEEIFDRIEVEDRDRVPYGTTQLKGHARDWWDVKKSGMTTGEIKALTWDDFKTPFLEHHSPQVAINIIKEEFLQLRHRGETIDEFSGVFMDKLKLCKDLVRTEQQKIYYYHHMLGAEYCEFLTQSRFQTLTEIINAAREREHELK